MVNFNTLSVIIISLKGGTSKINNEFFLRSYLMLLSLNQIGPTISIEGFGEEVKRLVRAADCRAFQVMRPSHLL